MLDKIYNGMDFCTGISDDMIIWSEKADGNDHNEILTKFIQATRQQNLKLNTYML